jgi:hypothetical protein
MDRDEVITILEERLAGARRTHNEMTHLILAALNCELDDIARELLTDSIDRFARSDAGVPPKRIRRRARRLQYNADKTLRGG